MKKIVLESFLSYRFLSGAACSPSGARAAFLSHTPCLAANRYQSSLWVYRDGGETRLGSRDDIREFLWLDEDTLLVSVDGGDLQTTLLSVNLGGVEQEFARLPCRASLAGRLRDGRIVLTVEERPERLEKLLHLDGRDREDAPPARKKGLGKLTSIFWTSIPSGSTARGIRAACAAASACLTMTSWRP